MPMNVSRVGHLAIDTEFALSEMDTLPAEVRPRLFVVPFRVDLPVANRDLLRLWKINVRSIPQWFGESLIWLMSFFSRSRKLSYLPPKGIAGRFTWGHDPFGVTAYGESHLRIPTQELLNAYQSLEEMGLDLAQPFVCLHVRDGHYHKQHSRSTWQESKSWRNIELQSFGPAIEVLVREGFQVVRLGVHAKERLPGADEKRIFDYATNGFRSGLLDIVLASKCDFMISTSSGIDSLAQVFRKPLYLVGIVAPSQLCIHRRCFSIVQRFFNSGHGRNLSLTESSLLALPSTSDADLAALGLVPVQNTPEEIAALASEAVLRSKGVWNPTVEDLEMHHRFLALLPTEFLRFPIRGGIGSGFLQKHQDWLN